jgi:hypothetical protein
VKVLENPSYLTEEIKALDADRVKAESLKLFLQSSDRRKDLEVRRRIACVNQWLNHKTEIVKSGDSESEGYVLAKLLACVWSKPVCYFLQNSRGDENTAETYHWFSFLSLVHLQNIHTHTHIYINQHIAALHLFILITF